MAKLILLPKASLEKYFCGTFPESSLMALAGYVHYFAAIVREEEGMTAVFTQGACGPLRLYSQKDFEGPFALITFSAKTDLHAIGITAQASNALAKEKIPANFLAGFHHDHLLVPYEKKDAALAVLKKLQKST